MGQIVKTKPILYATEMVQAILEGRKTQTRRTKGLEEINKKPDFYRYNRPCDQFDDFPKDCHIFLDDKINTGAYIVKCPYEIGDILWVRETFTGIEQNDGKLKYHYKADSNWALDKALKIYWKPSIHMPKEAARLFLKITNIRVERLFEISEEDAISEGIECKIVENMKEYRAYLVKDSEHVFGKNSYPDTPQCSFLELWEKINGKESVNSNPWVWVIEFEKVDKPENF